MMKNIPIDDIVRFLKYGNYAAEYSGDPSAVIHGFSNITDLHDGSIAWIKNRKYLNDDVLAGLKQHPSVVIVCPWKLDDARNCIVTDNPKEVYFSILNEFFKERRPAVISERATVETDRIGSGVSIGPGCYVCKDAVIGDDVILHANVVIDCPCTIGKGTEIFAGTVIGADGFGYYHHDGVPERVPHFGGVIIGEYVDIGANTCIDRGTLNDTVIGDNVKIDNLCHIGHNVHIKKNSFIVAGSTLCGSTQIGMDSYIAPNAVIKNQVCIGDNVFVGMNTVINRDVDSMSMAIDFSQSPKVLKNKDYRSITL